MPKLRVFLSIAVCAFCVFWIIQVYPRSVFEKATSIAGDDDFCFFEGFFIQGDVPIARLVSDEKAIPTVFDDFWDRYINSEQAKPFHFGFVVLRDVDRYSQANEAWGWSYWQNAYWQENARSTLNLAYRGNIFADCQEIIKSR